MKELNEIVTKTISDMTNSGTIEKIIKEKLEKSIDSVFSEVFSYNSKFRETFRDSIEKVFDFDTSKIDLEVYNKQIINTVKAKLNNFFKDKAGDILKEEVEKMLPYIPEEMTFDQFIKYLIKEKLTDICNYDLLDFAEIQVEYSDISYKDYHVDIKLEKDKKYSLSFRENGELVGDFNQEISLNPVYTFNEENFLLRAICRKLRITDLKDQLNKDFEDLYEVKIDED